MKRHYEIRYGRKAMMYTLWLVILPGKDENARYHEHYCYNLSTDFKEAVKKAEKAAKRTGFEVSIDAPEELREIVRGGDVLRWGKFRDVRVSDIPDEGYIFWLFKGAYYKDGYGGWDNKLGTNDPIRLAAEKVLLDRGLLVEYNDRLMTVEKAEELKRINDLNAASDYVGNIGDKIEAEVIIEKKTYFQGYYGTTFVTIMRDDENNVFVYKGKCLYAPCKYEDLITGKIFNENDKVWKNLIKIGVDKGRYHTFYGHYNTSSTIKENIRKVDFKGQSANFIDSETMEFYNMNCINDYGQLKEGDRIKIKATIKDHNEYNNTKQTILQRVKVL